MSSKFPLLLPCITLLSGCSLFLGDELGSDNASVFDYFWNTFDTRYALFELKTTLDWDETRSVYREHAVNAETDEKLFSILSEMIAPFNDAHVWLYRPDANVQFDAYRIPQIATADYSHSIDKVKPYLIDFQTTGSNIVSYGTLRTLKGREFGYLHISSFIGETGGITPLEEAWVHDADRVIDGFVDLDAIIIDVRGNLGGYRANALHIASRFVRSKKHYMKSKVRVGPGHSDFGAITDHYIEPRGHPYTKTVYLITDINTVSAGEWFVLMLEDESHVSHMGWRTLGALGLVSYHELPNGWHFSMTIGYTTDENGDIYEENGIEPNETPPHYDPDKSADPVLDLILEK